MKILRTKAMLEKLGGISRATLWRWSHTEHFPRKIQLSDQIVGWCETDVNEWIEKKQKKEI
jgi:predicted DNA-binding transcriptional regulator AlpA